MVNVLGESAYSYTQQSKLDSCDFNHGRTSNEDELRIGHTKTATSPEINYEMKYVHDMVLDDRQVKVREIANAIGISKDRVGYTLHEELHMKKLCARWVLHLLTIDQRIRMRIFLSWLDCFKQNKQNFKRSFITILKTTIHYYTPERKKQSKQWKCTKEGRTVQSAGKIMATVFWNY